MLHLVKSRQKIELWQATTPFSPHFLIFWVQVKLPHKSIFGFLLLAVWWLSQIGSEWPPFTLRYSITTRDAWWIRDWIQYNVFTVLQQTRAIVSVPESMWAQAWPATSVWAKRVWPLHHRQWGTHKIHFQTLVHWSVPIRNLYCVQSYSHKSIVWTQIMVCRFHAANPTLFKCTGCKEVRSLL